MDPLPNGRRRLPRIRVVHKFKDLSHDFLMNFRIVRCESHCIQSLSQEAGKTIKVNLHSILFAYACPQEMVLAARFLLTRPYTQ